MFHLASGVSSKMSGQKRPCDPSGSVSSGAPPEKRREREAGEETAGVSTTAGGSTAVETVIKLGGVSNPVRKSAGVINLIDSDRNMAKL